MPSPPSVCRTKPLSPEQERRAHRLAVEANPANAFESQAVARTPVGRRGGRRRLAVVIARRWPASGVRLTVQFLDSPPTELRRRILAHMNAWNASANVQFTETRGTGQVRIARLDSPEDMAGYWSYIGTEILAIEENEPTLNLEGFTMRMVESEFRRVVRHEAGHTLGFEHEHMRKALVAKIDRKKAIAFYDEDQGWPPEETEAQVLTPLESASLMGTAESDPTSIMCYHVPGSITKDGQPIVGGRDINKKDYAFAAKTYPKPAQAQRAALEPAVGPAAEPEASHAERPVPMAARAAGDGDTFHLVIMDNGLETADAARTSRRPRKAAANDKGARFARLFASYGGARVAVPLRLRTAKGEEPTPFGQIIRVHERIKRYTEREGGTIPGDEEMVAFGSELFNTLFPGDVKRLYDEARARQGSRRLNFVLTSMVPWIAEKPWEFAYDHARRSFLATEDIHFVRNVLTAVPADRVRPDAGLLRLLVASAQPVAFERLSVEEEAEVIRRGFAPLVAAGLAAVDVVARVTPQDLHDRVSSGRYNVLHFIGHGGFDPDAQEGFLVFEDGRGGEARLGERSAREILCQRGLRLVFLNACQTGRGGIADFNRGVAQALVAHGVPALVANQYAVLDSSATSFSQRFYRALGLGATVGEAAREARIAVNYSLQGDSIDWAVPVVYARDPDMVLAGRGTVGRALPAPAVEGAPARRGVAGGVFRVAVWDMDQVFPFIEGALRRMNEVQSSFEFDLVTTSTPIDIWDLETRAPDGTPYLFAERLARRVGNKAADLQADALACLTRHWLRDEDTLNLYGWWPDRGKAPVLIFSAAGFDCLRAAGRETDRAIANVLVTTLAGHLADVGTHRRAPQSCPLGYNKQRKLESIAGRQAFDPTCRARLKKRIPERLPALEVLLKAFP